MRSHGKVYCGPRAQTRAARQGQAIHAHARVTQSEMPHDHALRAVRAWRAAFSRARGPITESLEWNLLDVIARSAGVFDGYQLLSSGESHDGRMADDVASAMRSTLERQRARVTRAPRVTPRVPVAQGRWWKEGATAGGRGATGWPMFDFKIAPRRIYGGQEQWAVFRMRTWEDGPPVIDRMTEWIVSSERAWIEAMTMAQGVSEAEARANPQNPHPVRLLNARGACVHAFRAGYKVPCP